VTDPAVFGPIRRVSSVSGGSTPGIKPAGHQSRRGRTRHANLGSGVWERERERDGERMTHRIGSRALVRHGDEDETRRPRAWSLPGPRPMPRARLVVASRGEGGCGGDGGPTGVGTAGLGRREADGYEAGANSSNEQWHSDPPSALYRLGARN
jgi:hypothetical protein